MLIGKGILDIINKLASTLVVGPVYISYHCIMSSNQEIKP
jgi:hypothetical protein